MRPGFDNKSRRGGTKTGRQGVLPVQHASRSQDPRKPEAGIPGPSAGQGAKVDPINRRELHGDVNDDSRTAGTKDDILQHEAYLGYIRCRPHASWIPRGSELSHSRKIENLAFTKREHPQRKTETFAYFKLTTVSNTASYCIRPDNRILQAFRPKSKWSASTGTQSLNMTFVILPADKAKGQTERSVFEYLCEKDDGDICRIEISVFAFKKGIYWQKERAKIWLIGRDNKRTDIKSRFKRIPRLPYEPQG
jgi:hypothetical protein